MHKSNECKKVKISFQEQYFHTNEVLANQSYYFSNEFFVLMQDIILLIGTNHELEYDTTLFSFSIHQKENVACKTFMVEFFLILEKKTGRLWEFIRDLLKN